MLDDRPPKRLSYSEKYDSRGREYLLRRGERIVGLVASRGDAELICRYTHDSERQAAERANDLRRHEIEKTRMKQEIELLVATLRKVTSVIKRGKEKEMLAAREEAYMILRRFSRIQSNVRNGRGNGFSAVEALVVLVLVGVLLTFATSVISQGVRAHRIRSAAQQLTVDLRLARLTAVSKRSAVDFVVSGDPVNAYQFTDARGTIRRETMPPGVRITASTSPIRFLANGSVQGGATTVLEGPVTEGIQETRTIVTSVLGVPRMTITRSTS